MLCVHSRTNRGSSFGPRLPSLDHVPPLSFHPTPTVYSAQHPAGLLHPATGHGVRHVSGPLLNRSPRGPGRAWGRSRWRRPSEAFPSLVAVPCHHGLSPLAVEMRFPLAVRLCCHRVVAGFRHASRPQGLEPPRSPLRASWRCRQMVARCFLGLLILSRFRLPRCGWLRRTGRSRCCLQPARGRAAPGGEVLLLSSVRPRASRVWRQRPLLSSVRPRASRVWLRIPLLSSVRPRASRVWLRGRRASGPPGGGPSMRRGEGSRCGLASEEVGPVSGPSAGLPSEEGGLARAWVLALLGLRGGWGRRAGAGESAVQASSGLRRGWARLASGLAPLPKR